MLNVPSNQPNRAGNMDVKFFFFLYIDVFTIHICLCACVHVDEQCVEHASMCHDRHGGNLPGYDISMLWYACFVGRFSHDADFHGPGVDVLWGSLAGPAPLRSG